LDFGKSGGDLAICKSPPIVKCKKYSSPPCAKKYKAGQTLFLLNIQKKALKFKPLVWKFGFPTKPIE
jgi:hypothetical protein